MSGAATPAFGRASSVASRARDRGVEFLDDAFDDAGDFLDDAFDDIGEGLDDAIGAGRAVVGEAFERLPETTRQRLRDILESLPVEDARTLAARSRTGVTDFGAAAAREVRTTAAEIGEAFGRAGNAGLEFGSQKADEAVQFFDESAELLDDLDEVNEVIREFALQRRRAAVAAARTRAGEALESGIGTVGAGLRNTGGLIRAGGERGAQSLNAAAEGAMTAAANGRRAGLRGLRLADDVIEQLPYPFRDSIRTSTREDVAVWLISNALEEGTQEALFAAFDLIARLRRFEITEPAPGDPTAEPRPTPILAG